MCSLNVQHTCIHHFTTDDNMQTTRLLHTAYIHINYCIWVMWWENVWTTNLSTVLLYAPSHPRNDRTVLVAATVHNTTPCHQLVSAPDLQYCLHYILPTVISHWHFGTVCAASRACFFGTEVSWVQVSGNQREKERREGKVCAPGFKF